MGAPTTARHRGPVDIAGEISAHHLALTGRIEPLRGKRHKAGAEARVRCLRNAWESSVERRTATRAAVTR
jgi:hypothetical protein